MSHPNLAANKALALKALTGIFNDRDAALLDTLFASDYIQHNPAIGTGRAALKEVAKALSPDLKYEPGLIVAEGDYVMVHGRYTGWGPKPVVGVDIFRVIDGVLVEHWDVLQEEVPADQTKSGNPMFANLSVDQPHDTP
jgi:predicted SnoaL-like aldol condensation-catalyzing enzyme